MQVLNKETGDFDESDLEVLEILASIAATAIQNAQLHRDAQLSAIAHAVGDLSHEIKNKVSPIKLVVDTLREMMDELFSSLDSLQGSLPERDREELARASDTLRGFYGESFDITLDQVQEVQDYTKLIADAFKGVISEPELIQNELVPLVTRQLDLLESSAKKTGVKIVRNLLGVPPFTFDAFQIKSAVYNLVNNAIPETPSGGQITVLTGFAPEGAFPDGGYVLIEVRDTGRGMPAQVLERILKGDAKSTKPGGTGLGTRIVYNAVAAHKGVLEGVSSEGVGTTFRIKLPFRR
jgi:signal transduction histidine kinase